MAEATSNEPQKSNKAGVVIALLSIIIIIQAVKIYLDYQEKSTIREEKAYVEEELGTTMQRLNEIKTELESKIQEIQKLGGDVEELKKAKAEVDAELKSARKRSDKAIRELKDRVEGYEELLRLKDEEIEKLKVVNKELYSENRNLKTKQNVLNDSINKLAQNKNELATKVAIASQLKAENINVWAVNDRGKERESPFRNRQLEKLKVEFNIAENKVAPIEGKKIFIRVVDENGKVIFDVARGSGSFILNGREEFYTSVQEILFDNTKQKLTFFYEKGSEYVPGTYTIEVFTDGYKMGAATFVVK